MSLHESGDDTAERRQTTLERRHQNISAFRSSDSLSRLKEQQGTLDAALEVSNLPSLPLPNAKMDWQPLYAGLAVAQSDDGDFEYCVALHDGTWTVNSETKPLDTARSICGSSDGSSRTGSGVSTPLSMMDASEALVTAFIDYLSIYRTTHLSKPTGAGITAHLHNLSPHLAVRLWQELDVVPFIFPIDSNKKDDQKSLPLDQQAEYMARKTAKRFNVRGELPVRMGHRREVLVDLDGCVKITELDSYNNTAKAETTGAATMHYADSLKKKKTKIAFFNR